MAEGRSDGAPRENPMLYFLLSFFLPLSNRAPCVLLVLVGVGIVRSLPRVRPALKPISLHHLLSDSEDNHKALGLGGSH